MPTGLSTSEPSVRTSSSCSIMQPCSQQSSSTWGASCQAEAVREGIMSRCLASTSLPIVKAPESLRQMHDHWADIRQAFIQKGRTSAGHSFIKAPTSEVSEHVLRARAPGARARGDALVQLLAQAALQARAAAVGLAAALPALAPPVVVQVQPRTAAPGQRDLSNIGTDMCCLVPFACEKCPTWLSRPLIHRQPLLRHQKEGYRCKGAHSMDQ